MDTIPEIPSPPFDYGYAIALLAGICAILLFGVASALVYITKLHKSETERNDIEAERRSSDAEKFRKQWDEAEIRRSEARQKLREEVRNSTSELSGHIDEFAGRFNAKFEEQGKEITALVLRIQRLEDNILKK